MTEDVRPYYEECTVLVLPSYREGFGLVIAEAGAIGRSSITGNTEGTKEVVKNELTGFLIKIKNEFDIAEKAIWCLEHPEEAEQMGKNARTFAEEHFDAKKINENVFHLVNKI